jgi:hypothetical protein
MFLDFRLAVKPKLFLISPRLQTLAAAEMAKDDGSEGSGRMQVGSEGRRMGQQQGDTDNDNL